MDLKNKRLTFKVLVNWINHKFNHLGLENYEATHAYRTYYTSDQYEGGAAKIIVSFRNKLDHRSVGYFNVFYSIKELSEYLSLGYDLTLVPDRNCRFNSITNLTIEPKR